MATSNTISEDSRFNSVLFEFISYCEERVDDRHVTLETTNKFNKYRDLYFQKRKESKDPYKRQFREFMQVNFNTIMGKDPIKVIIDNKIVLRIRETEFRDDHSIYNINLYDIFDSNQDIDPSIYVTQNETLLALLYRCIYFSVDKDGDDREIISIKLKSLEKKYDLPNKIAFKPPTQTNKPPELPQFAKNMMNKLKTADVGKMCKSFGLDSNMVNNFRDDILGLVNGEKEFDDIANNQEYRNTLSNMDMNSLRNMIPEEARKYIDSDNQLTEVLNSFSDLSGIQNDIKDPSKVEFE